MSEENQETPVIETTGTATETPQQATEVEVVEPVESKDDIIARLTSERDTANNRADKSQRGLIKVKKKGKARADAISQERDSFRSRLHEYTGAETVEPKQPTMQEIQRTAEYKVKCDTLLTDEPFMKLHKERAHDGSNPFLENDKFENVLAQRGIDPKISRYILTDDDLCDRLCSADDEFEIVALVELANERNKIKSSKAKESETKQTKPVNEPKSVPSLKTNNNTASAVVKNQSTEDWYETQFLTRKRR